MNRFLQLAQALQGYRTYLASAATILTAVATIAGVVSPVSGAALGTAFLSVATIFQRMATADVANATKDVKELATFAALMNPASVPADDPATLKFPSPAINQP